MIRQNRIKSLYKEVGLRQSPLTDYAIVDADNQISESGLYYQDASNIVTVRNIKDAQQAVSISDLDFNAYLKQIQEASVSEVARAITEDETDFIQSVNLYPYEKTFDEAIEKRGKFVGFILEPYANVNVTGKISWVDLAFNEAVTFNVYLYNSNKPNTPIQTQEVTTIANESVIVDLSNWYLADDDTSKGGNYYFGYFEDDLGTAKALRKNWDLSSYEVCTKAFHTRPISLDHTGQTVNVRTRIDESFTYGLNCGVEIFNDYTELLMRNRSMLSKAIQFQFVEKVLDLIATSVRSNRNTRIIESETVVQAVQFELYGNPDLGILGIKSKLQKQLDKIKKSLFHKPRIRRSTLSNSSNYNTLRHDR